MGKTTLRNNSGFNVQLTGGNSNIFREHPVLEKGMSMTIQADSRATYYEYVLYKLPENQRLGSFSSDDIQRLSTIEISRDFELMLIPREAKSFLGKVTSFIRGVFSSIPDPAPPPPAPPW